MCVFSQKKNLQERLCSKYIFYNVSKSDDRNIQQCNVLDIDLTTTNIKYTKIS